MAAWVLSAGGMPPAKLVRVSVYRTLARCEAQVMRHALGKKVVRRDCAPDRVQWILKDHATQGEAGLAALTTAALFEATCE